MKKITSLSCMLVLAVFVVLSIPSVVSAQNENSSEADLDAIRSELSSTRVSYDFKDTQFREVINRIRQQVSFNIIISDKVDQVLGQGGNAAGGPGGAGGNAGNNAGFGNDDAGGSGGFGNNNSNSGGGFGDSGNSEGGFGNNDNSGGSGGFGSNDSGGGFGNNSGNSGGGFGNNDSGGGFGNSNSGGSGGGFGNNNNNSGGFGNNPRGGGGAQVQNVDDKVTIRLDDVTIERALKLILDQKNLTAIYKLGAVHIVPKSEAENFEIRFYDVRDLQFKLKDFKSPNIDFHNAGGYDESGSGSSGSGSSENLLSSSIYEESNDSGGEIITNKDQFMKLIEGNVGTQNNWGGKASMRMTNGILVVNQTPEMHEEINFLINRLRQFK